MYSVKFILSCMKICPFVWHLLGTR